MEKDWDRIARLEKAISKKYGDKAVKNPMSTWDEDKEKEYIEQLKEVAKKERETKEQNEKIEMNGFLMPKTLISKDEERNCPVCKVFSFNMKDDVYMAKYECCYKCYIQHVEGREKRLDSGWRPETGDK